MLRFVIVFLLIVLSLPSLADSRCNEKIERLELFQYYEEFMGSYWVRISSEVNGLTLKEVTLKAVSNNGKERVYTVPIPFWVEPMETQPYKLPDGIQQVELLAQYSDGCATVKYNQQFQDELASLGLDTLTIHWQGDGFHKLYSCFTGSGDKTIEVEF